MSVILQVVLAIFSMSWIQAIHTVRNRNRPHVLHGLSAVMLATMLWSAGAWLVYGIHITAWVSVINSCEILVSATVMTVVLARARLLPPQYWVSMLTGAIVWIGLATLIPPVLLGILASTVGSLFVLPQTIRSWRSVGDDEAIRAFSPVSTAVIIIVNTGWIIYGWWIMQDTWLTVSSSVLLSSGLAIAAARIVHVIVSRRSCTVK